MQQVQKGYLVHQEMQLEFQVLMVEEEDQEKEKDHFPNVPVP